MIYLEIALIAVMVVTCVISTVSDLKRGIIPNKLIVISSAVIVLLDFFYYFFFARDCFRTFILNFAVMAALAIIMYALNLWAAGDTKLLLVIVAAIPGRILGLGSSSEIAPAIFLIVYIFSIAYIYVIGESVFLSIKQKRKPDIHLVPKKIWFFLKQYYCCAIYILTISFGCRLIFPTFFSKNSSLLLFINLFAAIVIYKFKFFFNRIAIIIVSVLAAAAVGLFIWKNGAPQMNWIIVIYIALIIILRSVAEKDNHKIIKTEEVKPGMILSFSTVLLFEPSRIKGLPRSTAEDMRSRLSEEEAESIKRWKDSKYGADEIEIVRKIPFGIFMFLGTIVFLILKIALQ